MERRGLNPATVYARVSRLSAFYRWLMLRVVRGLVEAGSVVGKRDYALLLFYFLTGLRRSEVIGLRGKDVEAKEGTLIIKYRRKGGKFTAREVSHPSALEALTDYLKAAGRGNVVEMERSL